MGVSQALCCPVRGGCLTTLSTGPSPSPQTKADQVVGQDALGFYPVLCHPVLLFLQPESFPPKGPGQLTGVLPKDCVAHEFEEALGIEAGPVDGDCVL